jgi:hypothetical protein
LKHEGDAIRRSRDTEKGGASDRDRQTVMATGVQSILAYMISFKLDADARDMQEKARFPAPWKELLPLFRVVRADCGKDSRVSALLLRLQGICLVYFARALWTFPDNPEAAKDLVQNSKDQHDLWRAADKARKTLGVYDGSADSHDGGAVGKLLDRMGPWTSPEDATPITLDILRKTIGKGGFSWKPADELTKTIHPTTNGPPVERG